MGCQVFFYHSEWSRVTKFISGISRYERLREWDTNLPLVTAIIATRAYSATFCLFKN